MQTATRDKVRGLLGAIDATKQQITAARDIPGAEGRTLRIGLQAILDDHYRSLGVISARFFTDNPPK